MPQIPGFIGGEDVQRSLNLANNKCINLYPTTRDDGQIAAFYKCDGLKIEAGLSGVSSGAYRASNGRAFYVAAGVLYELTLVAGALTSTSRGAITNGISEFSDNGIDMIIVNGTDGWLFTFSTNTLTKIKQISTVVTISIAAPAIFGLVAHGLVVGDRIRLTTTGSLPTGLSISQTYYVIAAGFTADQFEVSTTAGGVAVNTTVAGSGTHTFTTLGFGFPAGCTKVDYMHGRFIAVSPNTQSFYVSEVLDGGWWDALNVQTADSSPDNAVAPFVAHNECIIFGDLTSEVFYDSGAYPSPFVRNVSGIFEVGCAAQYSIAKIDNSVMWLGQSSTGRGIVYRLNGYTPMRLSTYAIEYAIQAMTTYSDARAFAYQKDGHHFYVLTFPTGGRTFVYDINTNLWHERASFQNGVFGRWEVDRYFFFANMHLVTDYAEAKIYSIDSATGNYGGTPIKVVRSFLAPSSDMKRAIHHKLQLQAEVGVGVNAGVDPQVMLRWSDDGGHTWNNPLMRSIGLIGEYAKRIIWQRLGMTKGQPRLYEISCTEDVKIVLIAAYLD